MSRSLLVAALLALAAGGFVPAARAASFDVPRPPAVLSPDLTEPWLLQVKPDDRTGLSDPAPRRVASVPFLGFLFHSSAPKPPGIGAAFVPRVVTYTGPERPGTIIIDTDARYLYLVLDGGSAMRYGVGVGRPGFEWAGVHTITRKAEWPDWTPPPEMVKRQPWLPASMKGGPGNPLGARALYLGSTEYRIHGTAEPWTIGTAVSSGCIRMRNEDVIDLYGRVKVGTRVIVI